MLKSRNILTSITKLQGGHHVFNFHISVSPYGLYHLIHGTALVCQAAGVKAWAVGWPFAGKYNCVDVFLQGDVCTCWEGGTHTLHDVFFDAFISAGQVQDKDSCNTQMNRD